MGCVNDITLTDTPQSRDKPRSYNGKPSRFRHPTCSRCAISCTTALIRTTVPGSFCASLASDSASKPRCYICRAHWRNLPI
jgi:hypothetical protein